MAGTFTQVYYHLVFSTKDRFKFISEDIKQDLYSYICGILKNCEGFVYSIGGMADHIHILCSIPSKVAISETIKNLKVASTKWIQNKGDLLLKFRWQTGYGLFTVSHSQIEAVSTYIKNQQQHHEKLSFKDEFRLLLNKHNIDYDEKYIWV